MNENFIKGYILFLLILAPFNYLILPGMNIIMMVFSYFSEDIIYSFCMLFSVTLFWTIVSWFTYNKLFTNYF